MASARKKFKPKKSHQFEPSQMYGSFIGEVLAGTVTATRLHESRDARGNLDLEYDDPNGNGGGQGNQRALGR